MARHTERIVELGKTGDGGPDELDLGITEQSRASATDPRLAALEELIGESPDGRRRFCSLQPVQQPAGRFERRRGHVTDLAGQLRDHQHPMVTIGGEQIGNMPTQGRRPHAVRMNLRIELGYVDR